MKNWIKAHHNAIFNVLAIAGPVLAGVLSGGVFTLPVLVAAVSTVAAKLAQSPAPPPVPVAVSQQLDRINEKP